MSVTLPVPACVKPPVPVIFCPTEILSLRLKARVPLLVTVAEVPNVPVVPPLPICNVPALIVVAPLQSLSADNVVVPEPACMTLPVPDILAPTTKALSVRLKTRSELLVITLELIAPEVPALPICKVPPLIVVVPVYVLLPLRICVPVPFFTKLTTTGFASAGMLMVPLKVPLPLSLPTLRVAGLELKAFQLLMEPVPVRLSIV